MPLGDFVNGLSEQVAIVKVAVGQHQLDEILLDIIEAHAACALASVRSGVRKPIKLSRVSKKQGCGPPSWARSAACAHCYPLFDTDLDKVSDALDTARRKSVSKRGPKRVRQLRKVTG